jgi:hypothetical protein
MKMLFRFPSDDNNEWTKRLGHVQFHAETDLNANLRSVWNSARS